MSFLRSLCGFCGKLCRAFTRDYRLRLLLILLLGVVLIFTVQRSLLMLLLADRFSGTETGNILRSFLIGLRYDFVIASMAAVPLAAALLLVPHRFHERVGLRRIVVLYTAASFLGAGVIAVIDYFFFEEFFTRLDQKVFQYIQDDYVLSVVFDDYPVFTASALTAAAFLIIAAALGRAHRPQREGARVHSLLLLPLVAATLALGIRGSVGPKSINTGLAYFSSSIPLAQLALNGAFTLREAFDSLWRKNVKLSSLHPVLPEQEALSIAAAALQQEGDRFLNDKANPLLRVTHSPRPRRDLNVVIVILESQSWHYIGAMGGDARVSPNLDALAAEGALFDHCFAVGDRTIFGFSGIVGGFPDLPGASVTTRHESEGRFLTVGKVLQERGYKTMFVYGGSPLYDHRGAFLGSNGFSHLVFGDDFESRTYRTHLGWCDEDLYTQADRELRRAGDSPFLAVLLTLTFHRPYGIPDGRIERFDENEPNAKQLNAIRYADWAVGEFMKKARQSPYYEDTIFVFTADHTGGVRGNTMRPTSYRVPFIVYAPGIPELKGRRISTVCSQTDIAPTVMSLLGGSFTHSFFGSSVLDRDPDEGFALMQFGTRSFALINAQKELLLVPYRGGEEAKRLLHFSPPDNLTPVADTSRAELLQENLQRRAIAVLQTAELLYNRGVYDLPGVRLASQASSAQPAGSAQPGG